MDWTKVIIFSVLYLSMSILFYRVESEMCDRAERDTGIKRSRAVLALCSALWPFQIVGWIVYTMKG